MLLKYYSINYTFLLSTVLLKYHSIDCTYFLSIFLLILISTQQWVVSRCKGYKEMPRMSN